MSLVYTYHSWQPVREREGINRGTCTTIDDDCRQRKAANEDVVGEEQKFGLLIIEWTNSNSKQERR